MLASVINWGGYLASEAFEFLLSVTTGDDDLRSLLWREHQAHLGFEDILAREREISVRSRLRGGGRSRGRTGLQVQFPANSENNREF